MKHLADMEHAAGPIAFNKIGINSLVQRERKNSKHPKIFSLVIFKLTALKICLYNTNLYWLGICIIVCYSSSIFLCKVELKIERKSFSSLYLPQKVN
jgi:hypothetical protein